MGLMLSRTPSIVSCAKQTNIFWQMQERTLEEHRKLVEEITKRDKKRQRKIQEAGIDYECPEIVSDIYLFLFLLIKLSYHLPVLHLYIFKVCYICCINNKTFTNFILWAHWDFVNVWLNEVVFPMGFAGGLSPTRS